MREPTLDEVYDELRPIAERLADLANYDAGSYSPGDMTAEILTMICEWCEDNPFWASLADTQGEDGADGLAGFLAEKLGGMIEDDARNECDPWPVSEMDDAARTLWSITDPWHRLRAG